MEDLRNYKKIFGNIIEWLPKVYKIFQPYRPTAKYFELNYKSKTAIIRYLLNQFGLQNGTYRFLEQQEISCCKLFLLVSIF